MIPVGLFAVLVVCSLSTILRRCALGSSVMRPLRSTRGLRLVSQYGGLVALPAAIGLILVVAAFSFDLFQLPSNEVTLPIEVIGPDGHTVSVQVNASTPSDVEHLFLKAHSIGYPYHLAEGRGYQVDKASIKINDGTWVDVNNSTATCLEPAASARCVDGPMHTIEFRIPISEFGSLNDGANMIHFRFNYAHPSGGLGDASTGYRVLDVELQTSSGTDRIDGTTFSWDNPGEWSAPEGYSSSTSVDEGRQLWHQRDLLVDGWAGPEIIASCADCHVKNGYDLEYFAYSNKSIVQRARFHGLSESEGKQIAAYIRSIDIETEGGTTIDPPGRPWHPPYQPGPTAAGSRAEAEARTNGEPFSQLDPVYWAAGAGSQWAMTYDRDTKSYVFPDGLGSAATENLIDETINLREIPLALQMPDWNEWLPAVHPMDVWGSSFTDHEVWRWYTEEVPELLRKADNQNKPRKAAFAAKNIWASLMEGDKFRPSSAPAPYDDRTDFGVAELGRMQWGLTKTFETLHTNHYENDAKETYGPGAEDLQWLSDARVLFDQAPHIQSEIKGSSSGIMDRYHDAVWYQLQVIINPGSGISTDQKPVDWKYHWGHISAVNQPDYHTWQYVASYIKILQVAEDLPESYDPWSGNHPEGWYLRHLTPGALDRYHHWSEPLRPHESGGLTDEEYRQVLNVLFRALGDGMTPEPLSEWSRLEDDQYGIEPESAVPQTINRYDCCTYANHFWTVLKRAGDAGVDYDVLRPLAQWGGAAWPKGDWMGRIEPYKDNPPFDETSNTPPEARLITPAGDTTLSAGEDLTLEAEASDPDGSVAEVEFLAADSSLATDQSAPYRQTTSLPAGTYTLATEATDGDGASSTSSTVEVTVERADGTRPAPSGVARAYYEGRWERLPDFERLTATARDTTASFSIDAPRADEYGYRFATYLKISESGTYGFSLESDDGSRMYVDGALLIDNDGQHGPATRTGDVSLSPGYHRVVVDFFEAGGGQTLNVEWSPPNGSMAPIPERRLHAERPRATVTQTIPLNAGWNLVSTRVRPEDPSLRSVFGDALDLMVLTKDETGAVFSPIYDVTGLNTWTPVEGYQVYMRRDTSITVQGQALRTTAPIPLEQGWNVVSYLPRQGMSVEEAFASLGESLVIVKDYQGYSYIPDRTDDISTAQPTEGYKLYVQEPDTLTYPATATTSGIPRARAAADTGASTGGVARPHSATVLVEAPSLPANAQIRAVANGEVVGTGALTDGSATLAVRGSNRLSASDSEGAEVGEQLTFVAGGEETRTPLQVSSATNFLSGRTMPTPVTFAKDAVYTVELASAHTEHVLSENAPNPARRSTAIRFTLPSATEVTLTVYNVLGQRVATLVDGSRTAGQHRVQLDVSDLSSGVYFYRLNAGDFNKSRKMTVVK
jgi:hypothetical protein